MGFSRQEYWTGWLFPPPGDLPDPGIEPVSLSSPALGGGFFATAPPGKPWLSIVQTLKNHSCLLLPGEGKSWYKSPESRAGLIGGRLLLYEASSWKEKRCLLCLMSRHQHRESRKIKNQAKVFYRKKSPETNPNAMELHVTTWMQLEDIKLGELTQSQKENTIWFYLTYEVFKIVKFK